MQEIHESALKIGTKLQEYEITNILGVGGFGVTYLAVDTNLKHQVVIKEFLPNDIAVRKEYTTVVPKSSSDKESFEWGMSRFIQEAQTLAQFKHPNIVRVNRFFQANGTAYFVMDYEKGQDLEEYLKKSDKPLSEDEILQIIIPILDGLREVHLHDFLHRDIKPGNIFIRDNGTPMLIDFGASRFAMGSKSKSLSVVLTEGYAPKEQYSSKAKQGAYTDIYAIGAVMYKMATGITPIEASERTNAITDDEPDPLIKLQDKGLRGFSDSFCKAIDWALEFKPKDRPQEVKEFQDVVMQKETVKFQIEEIANKEEYPKYKNQQEIVKSSFDIDNNLSITLIIYFFKSTFGVTLSLFLFSTYAISLETPPSYVLMVYNFSSHFFDNTISTSTLEFGIIIHILFVVYFLKFKRNTKNIMLNNIFSIIFLNILRLIIYYTNFYVIYLSVIIFYIFIYLRIKKGN